MLALPPLTLPMPVEKSHAQVSESCSASQLTFERYTLANGLEVILHSDRKVPLVAVDLWYHVGSGDESVGKSGFAHLFEHMMFQGAKHIGKDVHFDLLRKIGASSVNGTTNKDRTNYYEVVPSNELETALWLESDRMGYLLELLNQDSLDTQIAVVRNERRQRYDNVPFGKERFVIAQALYPEAHPYRYLTIGKHEDIENAALDDVQAFFRKWYVPSNATIVLAGDFERGRGRELIEKWFGAFPKLAPPIRRTPDLPALAATVRTELHDDFARYSRLHYAWPAPCNLAAGDAELTILARVLAATGWGRLHKALVLDRNAAQSVSAYQRGCGLAGEFHVVVNIKPGHSVDEVEPVVREELARVLARPIEVAELDRVVNQLESGFVWGLEEMLARAERLQYFNHFAGDPGFTDTYLARLRSRTAADVLSVTQEILNRPRVEVVTLPGAQQSDCAEA